MSADTPQLDNYKLEDRYLRESGRVFLTGTQALVRIPLMQAALDRKQGLKTAGMVSGYRGSPLGAVDQALWQAKGLLDENRIDFVPAINEDLAATIMLGTQQVETDEDRQVDDPQGAAPVHPSRDDPAKLAISNRRSPSLGQSIDRSRRSSSAWS